MIISHDDLYYCASIFIINIKMNFTKRPVSSPEILPYKIREFALMRSPRIPTQDELEFRSLKKLSDLQLIG